MAENQAWTYEDLADRLTRQKTDEQKLSFIKKAIQEPDSCTSLALYIQDRPADREINLLYFLRSGGILSTVIPLNRLSEEMQSRIALYEKRSGLPILISVGSSNDYNHFLNTMGSYPDLCVALAHEKVLENKDFI